MNKIILVLSLLAISSLAMPVNLDELKSLWSSWKGYYDKSYGLAEEAARFAIFVENYKRIVEFNGKNTEVKQALNQFADITGEEFKNLYSKNFFETVDIRNPDPSAYDSNIELPTSVDWRTEGAVTPVKNQGQCGSCWAFSATGALEGLYFIDTGSLVPLSEQALVDCVSNNQGCNGGSIAAAFAYTAKHGVPTEADYPYNGQSGNCQSDKKSTRVNSGFEWVPFQSALALKTAVAKQPVSVSIEADQEVFQFYSSGVISSGCGSETDHAVLVVGYDGNSFIVKNSWGASWGQNGYVMISTDGSANNGNGVCGILSGPVIPVK